MASRTPPQPALSPSLLAYARDDSMENSKHIAAAVGSLFDHIRLSHNFFERPDGVHS
jgi:S-methylmethionine-dependent homocysteine/selenocysteine methylase